LIETKPESLTEKHETLSSQSNGRALSHSATRD